MRFMVLALLALLLAAAAPRPATLFTGSVATSNSPQRPAINETNTDQARLLEEQAAKREQRATDARQEAREIEDLAAQKDMALIGRLQFYVSVVGALIAALSVGFTLAALWQTSKSLAIARSTAHAELRAYLGFGEFDPAGFLDGVEDDIILRWGLENLGNTPAGNIRSNLVMRLLPGQPYWDDASALEPDGWGMTRDIPPRGKIGVFVPLDGISREDQRAIAKGEKSLLVSFVILYTDVFGEEHMLSHSEIKHGKGLAVSRFNMGFQPATPHRPTTS